MEVPLPQYPTINKEAPIARGLFCIFPNLNKLTLKAQPLGQYRMCPTL